LPDDRQSGEHARDRRNRGRTRNRLHGHPGGDRRHDGGRTRTAAHVRVPTGAAVHSAVGNAGQWLHLGCGRHRANVADKGVAGPGRSTADWHDAGA